jgi:hypothetical protein
MRPRRNSPGSKIGDKTMTADEAQVELGIRINLLNEEKNKLLLGSVELSSHLIKNLDREIAQNQQLLAGIQNAQKVAVAAAVKKEQATQAEAAGEKRRRDAQALEKSIAADAEANAKEVAGQHQKALEGK